MLFRIIMFKIVLFRVTLLSVFQLSAMALFSNLLPPTQDLRLFRDEQKLNERLEA
jgi:hypothetical protein